MTTKERIVQEAKRLFFQYGVRNVTMNDIANQLGMSKRTIYENVKDKDELLSECIDQFECDQDKEIDSIDLNVKMIDLLKALINHGAEIIQSELGNFIIEVKKYHPKVFLNNIQKHKEKRYQRTVAFIEKGIRDGFFKKDINVEIIALILTNAFVSFDSNESLNLEKKQISVAYKAVVLTFCRGLATVEGIKEIDKNF